MKKVLPLLIVLITGALAQGQTVTFARKNATLPDVLKAIEKQTGFGYLIDRKVMQFVRPVDIEVEKAPVRELLTRYCKDQPITFVITKNMISITVRPGAVLPRAEDVITITGRIVNEKNEPVPGATISVTGNNRMIATNDEGEFTLAGVEPNTTLLVTSVNYEPQEVRIEGQPKINIQMKPRASELSEVSIVSTGYQDIDKEKNPGAFTKIDNELLNRRVSTNLLDRLDGVTAGMIFNKNITPGLNQSTMSIRGRSTIFSNAEPLVVVDNFPYPGDPNNINPNDVENITILKDANAAAIWGAFAGNGVIVIKTKKGRFRQEPKLSINSNITIGGKPDAYYLPILSTGEYIDLEMDLFEQGYYSTIENNPIPLALSPVIETLIAKRDGLITSQEADERINYLRQQDVRREREKHFYRSSVNQQYSINTSGGGANNHYYLSVGFDRNVHNLNRNNSQRLTLNANNTYAWLKNRLELNTGIGYSENRYCINNYDDILVHYPYLSLSDGAPAHYDIRQTVKDEASQAGLLDWSYRPLQEVLESNNINKVSDLRANINVKVKLAKGLVAKVLYQFNNGTAEHEIFKNVNTYFTRNLINKYTQVDTAGNLSFPIPNNKGIADISTEKYKAHNVRAQLSYSHSYTDKRNGINSISVLAGAEVRDIEISTNIDRQYGYEKGMATGAKIDYDTAYPIYYAPFFTQRIPKPIVDRTTVDRYVSFFATSAFTWHQKYALSLSVRKDESNLFGVRTNQKGVPLYSVGASWNISSEKFYRLPFLPTLKLRFTHGYNGNVNKSVSAYTSATISNDRNLYGAFAGTIVNPPNDALRWEKIQITNWGVDFSLAKEVINASIDYYYKRGTDLIGISKLNPTTGNVLYRGNTAKMEGRGIDVMITAKAPGRALKWQSVILFNHTIDKITSYENKPSTIASYYNSDLLSPLEDRPLYAIYSLKWGGLDPLTGDPQGFFNGHSSKDYDSIYYSSRPEDLVYSGPANPTYFGSVRNEFSYRNWSLSVNVVWKAGYYFRRPSIEYTNLYNGSAKGHPDFVRRWKNPGDENHTSVPSLIPVANDMRDIFYRYSEVLVEKGDHIRLQDIQIFYDLTRSQIKKLPMQLVRFYLYANNLGILWKANEKGIDPDNITTIPTPRSFAFGIKIEF